MSRAKGKGPKQFSQVLLPSLSTSDSEWSFYVPSLPGARECEAMRLVKCVSVIRDLEERRFRMVLRLETMQETRATKGHALDRFVLVSIADFRPMPRSPEQQAEQPQQERRGQQPASRRECVDYVARFLRTGIAINSVRYHFYGHSNSQLKSRSCLLYAASPEAIGRMVEGLGDFSTMKTVAKKAKRIGLLFSTAQAAMVVPPAWCEDVAGIESSDTAGGYIFTDGCGLIGRGLAQDLARRLRIVFRDKRYTPSVFQLRYRGYKGVVMVDPSMGRGPTQLKFRKSMKKFSGGDDFSFSVVEYSKPYVFGHLNDETILLLHALGISREVLLRKQSEHLAFLAEAAREPRAAFRFLSYMNRPDLAERVMMDSLQVVRPSIQKLVASEYDKMLNKRDEQRCRILIPQSRLLFGICDAYGVLRPGECAVKVTMDGDGVARALKNCQVIVTRNPCLHPGDCQKLHVVERPELAHLVDCIVFPTVGRRPPADMMSGGDLDGDTFFVSWDPAIVPSTVAQPAEYPGAREAVTFRAITDDDRLVYFARYASSSLGRVKNLYLDWARVKGPMSDECQQLNRLFSQCVDGNAIRVPPKLEKVPAPAPGAEPFILDALHAAAQTAIAQARQGAEAMEGEQELDAFELLLARDDVAVSEFELVQMANKWCRQKGNGLGLADFLHYFDWNVLTEYEKAWVVSQLPPAAVDAGAAGLVKNALNSSSLLSPAEVRGCRLDHADIRWKRVYDSSGGDRLAAFLDAATQSLERFHRKLIVFQPDERLTLALYVPQPCPRAQDCLVDDRVRLLAFPHTQGPETTSRLILPTKVGYRLFCDEHVLQLFEVQRANTWVYLAQPGPADDSSYRGLTDRGDRRRQRQATVDSGINVDCRASVALNKFSQGLQRHIGRVNRNGISGAEIYVISNRDVKSMQNLDLWLEYIDTNERLPLFQKNPKEYMAPSMKDVDWSVEPAYLVRIARDRDPSGLRALVSDVECAAVFSWLIERNQRGFLLQSFHMLLEHDLSTLSDPTHRPADPSMLLQAMLDAVQKAPYLAVAFSQGPPWTSLLPPLPARLEASAVHLLRALILSAADVDDLVVRPMQTLLARIRALRMQDYADVVETVALAVRTPSLALDLLLQCLEPESERLLVAAGASPELARYVVRHLAGVTVEHIEEAADQTKTRDELLELTPLPPGDDGHDRAEVAFRLDAPGGPPEASAHVRLTAASTPSNAPLARPYVVDALVTESPRGGGLAKLRCQHPLPPFVQDCSWQLQHCGPFVTAKTMLDAVRAFAVDGLACCGLVAPILGVPSSDDVEVAIVDEQQPMPSLNASQQAAVAAALEHPLTCIWGPPGTGKTETIAQILLALQRAWPDGRLLVTAPTHNAVDNVLRRYLQSMHETSWAPLRVSTEVRKVAPDLRGYTCDAMAGAEVHSSREALRAAQKRIKQCRLVFSTCIGAGLGLLRPAADFDLVVIDEASQQTEPASLVPLTKGCRRAVLVGDHVQLRPTVPPGAAALDLDVSLFERLYGGTRVARCMLTTQYRMHGSLCRFPSAEFYGGQLQTGLADDARPLPPSLFPWPEAAGGRMAFVPCASPEDIGQRSKSNRGQVALCHQVCQLLATSTAPDDPPPKQSIAVLTPYARQAELLKMRLSPLSSSSCQLEVSSIDGFQGREADIVVFVTVRCNQHGEIGFLKDQRRMNVALTRCRAGLVVIGHRATLTQGTADPESTAMLARLLGQMPEVALETGDEK